MDSEIPLYTDTSKTAICDYEGSNYRTDFWTQSRTYEDKVERIALKSLLPPVGRRLVEIGAGFGRLTDLYSGYDQVVLFDYSRSLLRQARARWGDTAPGGRPHYLYVAGNFYNLPFAKGTFDVVTMIRAIHHAQNAPRVIQGIQNILASQGTFVLEFANKRNLKAIARWALRRQSWNPFGLEPYEFVTLNFDFHPRWMRALLRQTSFTIRAQRTVSHFRLGLLKRFIPTQWLVKLDGMIQPTGRWWQLAPSVFVKSQAPSKPARSTEGVFFRCPNCHSVKLERQAERLICQNCHAKWQIRDGLYDFKTPL